MHTLIAKASLDRYIAIKFLTSINLWGILFNLIKEFTKLKSFWHTFGSLNFAKLFWKFMPVMLITATASRTVFHGPHWIVWLPSTSELLVLDYGTGFTTCAGFVLFQKQSTSTSKIILFLCCSWIKSILGIN